MKKLTLLIIGLISVLSLYAESDLKDFIFKNGKERTHYIKNLEDYKNNNLSYDFNWWAVPTDSVTRFITANQFGAIVNNDLKKFCKGTEFENISALYLEVEPYASKIKPYLEDMQALRNIVLQDTLHEVIKDTWKYVMDDYDIDKKGFYINPTNVFMGIDFGNEKFPIYTEGDKMFWIAESDEELLASFHIAQEHYGDEYSTEKFFVPMSNVNLALQMTEKKNNEKEFSVMFQFVVDFDETNNNSPFYSLTDILLVYDPTQQVVWSAKTGDHSNEVKL